MTSARRIVANRRNARNSTGPKTSAGKVRASRNAVRHGFERAAFWDKGNTPEIEALARQIAGDDARGERLARACRIAAAQLDLVLVRQAKYEIASAAGFGRGLSDQNVADRQPKDWSAFGSLLRLDRYEQRAIARRRRAMRDFSALPLTKSELRKFSGTKPSGKDATVSKSHL